MKFKQGDKVKLKSRFPEPGCRMPVVLGQGEVSSGLIVRSLACEVFIPAGRVMQVSEDESLLVGDMGASPLPRISAGFVNDERFNKRFSKVT